MNNLDPAVAERPEDLIVYGGGGKAARNWACYERIVSTLRRLDNDETLLVQSGKPVGVFRTHEEAPRVLIANAHLVPRWATWDEFRRLDALGLTMYGQMTAGSWIYIGTQGILQGTYETFAECARQHFGGTLEGRLVVTGGLGGMGGAQPLAATMNGAAFLGVDVDESRIVRRVETRLLRSDRARSRRSAHARRGRASSPAGAFRGIGGEHRRGVARAGPPGIVPDVLTDQTSAHDLRVGYIPVGLTLDEAAQLRDRDPDGYESRVLDSMVTHVRRDARVAEEGGRDLRLRQQPSRARWPTGAAMPEAFDIPGFVPEFIRPLFCRGAGPFRWAALSGDPADIARPTRRCSRPFRRRTRWRAGSGRRSSGCSFRDFPPASAGSSTASGPRWACGSTGS